jgi:hypothetical protein
MKRRVLLEVTALLLAFCLVLIVFRVWVFPRGEFNTVNMWLLREGMSKEEVISLLGPAEEVPINEVPFLGDRSSPTGKRAVVKGSIVLKWRKSVEPLGGEELYVGLIDNVVVDIYHWVPSF